MSEYKHASFKEQVDLFESRDLKIEDKEKAAKKLEFINYYKLKELAYPFAIYDENRNYKYNDDISFNLLITRYYQDKNLRENISSCIEKIEVAFKTRLCHLLGERFGPYGYLNFGNWFNKEEYCKHYTAEKQGEFKERIKELLQKSKMNFIKEHFQKSDTKDKVPVWMIVELLTFGEVIVLYNWMSRRSRERIADAFETTPDELESWLRALKFVRNQCAHNSNVIDLVLKTKPKMRNEWKKFVKLDDKGNSTGALADVLVIMTYLTIKINSKYMFNELQRVINNIVGESELKAQLLGFKDIGTAKNTIRNLGGHFKNKNVIKKKYRLEISTK